MWRDERNKNCGLAEKNWAFFLNLQRHLGYSWQVDYINLDICRWPRNKLTVNITHVLKLCFLCVFFILFFSVNKKGPLSTVHLPEAYGIRYTGVVCVGLYLYRK